MTYLALGDSYTIAEGVSLHESFPYQAVQLMRKNGYAFEAPEIIAKTGWTTDELQAAMSAYNFKTSYDFVTLLIGVNNQYRGRTIDEYKQQFKTILKKSIRLASNQHSHVIVLSIPDWSVTPFAKDRDSKKIAMEIDQFNQVNKSISLELQTHYIDVTTDSREYGTYADSLAKDGLHPSAQTYRRWAKLVTSIMLEVLID